MAVSYRCPNCALPLQENEGECPYCGHTYCPECGLSLPADAESCSSCGAEFAAFCSECEQEVPNEAAVCPHCGTSLEEEDEDAAHSDDGSAINLILPARFSGTCPACASPVFLEDGFCGQCGAAFCSNCGESIAEEEEVCPHCQTALYFDCPLCGFELMTGSDQCPNCNALVPNYCTHCRAALPRDSVQCPTCSTAVRVISRNSARVIHSLRLGEQIVQVAACPGCGGHLHLHEGVCASCGFRICPACQISLKPDEAICPRCGPEKVQIVHAGEQTRKCPKCGHPLHGLDDECAHCQQLFCPQCFAPVADADIVCGSCGAEFDFECPQCGEVVGAEDDVCSSCGAAI